MENVYNENRFGWCFIGCGTLANIVAKQITDSERHRIVSAYSRTAEKTAAFTESWGGDAFDSAEAAMLSEGVDAVYIVTTHDSHYEYARLALLSGKNVLCEKPMTMTAAQSAELFALAEEKGLYIAEAMWTWFNPVANTVARWLAEGRLGALKSVRIVSHTDGMHYAKRVTDPMTAGGAVLDMGVYALAYCLRLFGSPDSLRCVGNISGGIDWSDDIELYYADGKSVPISLSVRDTGIGNFFEAVGENGTLTVEDYHEARSARICFNDGSELHFESAGSYIKEFDLVSAEMRAGHTESRYVPHSATLAVMQQLDECRRQMGLRYPFEVEDNCDK